MALCESPYEIRAIDVWEEHLFLNRHWGRRKPRTTSCSLADRLSELVPSAGESCRKIARSSRSDQHLHVLRLSLDHRLQRHCSVTGGTHLLHQQVQVVILILQGVDKL